MYLYFEQALINLSNGAKLKTLRIHKSSHCIMSSAFNTRIASFGIPVITNLINSVSVMSEVYFPGKSNKICGRVKKFFPI